MSCTMQAVGHAVKSGLHFVQWRRTRNPVKEQHHNVYRRMELPNTSLQAIDLYPYCPKQVHSNKLGTGREYESKEPKSILTILRVRFVIRHLSTVDWRAAFSCRVG